MVGSSSDLWTEEVCAVDDAMDVLFEHVVASGDEAIVSVLEGCVCVVEDDCLLI